MPETAIRPIDEKRLARMQEIHTQGPAGQDVWFCHTVLAQCFLPYRDPHQRDWQRTNGEYSIILTSGAIVDPQTKETVAVGLPYGAQPRLFQSYIATQAIKHQSPVIEVAGSMTGMMKKMNLKITGGEEGTIQRFKKQIIRFARCHYTIVAPAVSGGQSYINAPPIRKLDVWFPQNPDQETIWPSEIVLTDDYYSNLKDHAVPYDFRGLCLLQNKPRAQDIYLWMTQRLCRLDRPLLMKWKDLYEMFGGQASLKKFRERFPEDLLAARKAYPDARVAEHKEGFLFYSSAPPIPKVKISV